MELLRTHHQTLHGIEVRHEQFLVSEPDPLLLHEMVSDQDIPTREWGFQLVKPYMLRFNLESSA